MSIQFGNPLAPAAQQTASSKENLPKAKVWLNIGYDSGVADEKNGGTKFVSLAKGIAMDGMEDLPTNQRDRNWAAFQQARNQLRDEIMEASKTLKPGESAILQLQVQLRLVNDELPEPDVNDNQFLRRSGDLLA